jgi:hypothetical protein
MQAIDARAQERGEAGFWVRQVEKIELEEKVCMCVYVCVCACVCMCMYVYVYVRQVEKIEREEKVKVICYRVIGLYGSLLLLLHYCTTALQLTLLTPPTPHTPHAPHSPTPHRRKMTQGGGRKGTRSISRRRWRRRKDRGGRRQTRSCATLTRRV